MILDTVLNRSADNAGSNSEERERGASRRKNVNGLMHKFNNNNKKNNTCFRGRNLQFQKDILHLYEKKKNC